MTGSRRHRFGFGWPFGLILVQLAIAAMLAWHLGTHVTWPQVAFVVAGPVALRMTFHRPFLAATIIAAIDVTAVLVHVPIQPLLPSTVVAVVGPIARARREAYRQWQAEEQLRRVEEGRRKEADERVRIARELHDILAHSLSLINVRASVALEILETHPAEVRPALEAIKQASRDGLTDVRSVLAGLHGGQAPRTPAPDLSRLDDLVLQARAAGLSVNVETVGVRRALPAAVELAAYRMVQEALTNVMRHSAARAADVVIHYGEKMLSIGVADPGPAQPATEPGGGNGLIGIRERVRALGGTATAEPDGHGGFRVLAMMPS
ncbi:sensor histidine kinase [Hamadaea tsunoensis]|uniref:sensor histidine kinase n=1 Tax=Hamadaea tsunoensis TaxID=53368 RepID=UPI0003F7D780|nr:sensor histidine kinase [Hamadaea tsunoensis]